MGCGAPLCKRSAAVAASLPAPRSPFGAGSRTLALGKASDADGGRLTFGAHLHVLRQEMAAAGLGAAAVVDGLAWATGHLANALKAPTMVIDLNTYKYVLNADNRLRPIMCMASWVPAAKVALLWGSSGGSQP